MVDFTIDAKTQIGLQTDKVEKIRVSDYVKLKSEGLLIQLDIKGLSIFTTGTDWAEVGVGSDSTRAKWMKPGRKYLFPKEIVDRLNNSISKVRQAFNRCTHDLPGFAPYRYIHYKQYEALVTAWSRFMTELTEIKADMDAGYEDAVDTLAAEYNSIAHEAFQSAMSSGESYIVFCDKPYDDLDEFTDAMVASVMSRVPSREDIQTKITASYRTAIIQGAEEIAREEARAARIRAEAEEASQKAKQETDHQQRLFRMEEEAKQQQIEMMMHAEAEHIRSQLSEIVSPLEETFTGLRKMMSEAASEMIGKIQKNGHVHGKTAQRALTTLTELFEMRSIVDDKRLRERLIQLREAVGPVGDERTEDTPERSTDAVLAALSEIQKLVESAREDFGAEPSRFAMLE